MFHSPGRGARESAKEKHGPEKCSAGAICVMPLAQGHDASQAEKEPETKTAL
jgi:hypothetical protein